MEMLLAFEAAVTNPSISLSLSYSILRPRFFSILPHLIICPSQRYPCSHSALANPVTHANLWPVSEIAVSVFSSFTFSSCP